jgi:NADPH2:quinone reductase
VHAIRQYEFGPAENLRYEAIDDPRPAPGQVRIAVGAAGVHLIDTRIRAGLALGPFPLPELPMIPGREVAGHVEAVGDGVDDSWLGRRVVAHLGMASAGYAERAVVDVDALHVIPDALADDAAVAMVGTGRTTMALLAVAPITADDVVLATSAAGGIGSLLVQEAGHVGATFVGLGGSPAKLERVRSLGADLAVDSSRDGWEDVVRAGLDGVEPTVAFDGVGGEVGASVAGLVADGGRLVLLGGPTEDVPEHDRRRVTVIPLPRPEDPYALAAAALDAAASGRWVPVVQRFPLADAAAAHAALESRATMGKVVLVP